MSAINVNSITGRTGTHGPVLTGVTTATNGLNIIGGNVGIGTSVPEGQLHLRSGGPNVRFQDIQGGTSRLRMNTISPVGGRFIMEGDILGEQGDDFLLGFRVGGVDSSSEKVSIGIHTTFFNSDTGTGGDFATGASVCIAGTETFSSKDFGEGDQATIQFVNTSNQGRTNFIGIGSGSDSLTISADHFGEASVSAIDMKIDGVTILHLGDGGSGNDSYFSGGSNTSWFNFNCSGQNVAFNADDSGNGRGYTEFNYNCTDSNNQATGTTWGTLSIQGTNGTLELVRNTNTGNDAFLEIQGKTSYGSSNKITRFLGDSDALNIINDSPGDYSINNSATNHSISFANGTGGVFIHYADSASTNFGISATDGVGVKSKLIYDTTSSSTTNYLRISGSGTAYELQRSTSSRRYKDNITNYVGIGLTRIENITPKTWADHKTGEQVVGLIAEELHDIGFTEAVSYSEWDAGSELGYGDEPSYMVGNGTTPVTKNGEDLDEGVEVVDGISDRAVLCEMLIAIKQLKADNDSLRQRISTLESN